MVPAHLSACDSCPTYVNDATMPLAIAAAWQQAGCSMTPAGQTCGQAATCMTPTNNMCVDLGSGAGRCAFTASTGSGGAGGGAPDSGLTSCEDVEAQYQMALVAAQVCMVSVSGSCEQTMPCSLTSCANGCLTHVNGTTALNTIRSQWQSLGCDSAAIPCTDIHWLQPVGGTCAGPPYGAGTCQ
jgi:hypothetical protein